MGLKGSPAWRFRIEVRVTERSIDTLDDTYAALDWLVSRGYSEARDWTIDMHGGRKGYTSFYFKSQQLATEFSLWFI
jgi:hypothetical protein